jgi:hypothetical protein
MWLWVGTSGGLLWTLWWTFGFHKMQANSLIAEVLLAFQEGLCPMEWILSYLFSLEMGRVDPDIAHSVPQKGRGIESRWRRDFPHLFIPALGPTQLPVQWEPDHFPEFKRPGRGVDHPLPSSAEVKERVQLYLYSPSSPSCPVLGRTLPLLLYCRKRSRML